MKKILIVNNNMKVGGVQKSLYNLLWTLDKEKQYDITLLLFCKTGAYIQKLPDSVKIVECGGLFRYMGESQKYFRHSLKDTVIRGLFATIAKLCGRSAATRLMLFSQPLLEENFDFAVAYLHNGRKKSFYGGVQDYVLNCVKAEKKIALIHCDYKNNGSDNDDNNRLLGCFDKIAACSDGCRAVLEAAVPELKDKCMTVRNCHLFEEIKEMAEADPIQYDKSFINIVTVARLSPEKGIDRAIKAVFAVIGKGVNVKLHIVGDGNAYNDLVLCAEKLNITDNVIFHGEQNNPYRFMKNADLLFVPSYHEAAPMVIDEARCLGLPILTTETTSAKEMVLDANCGWVCENSQTSIDKALQSVLENREALRNVKKSLMDSEINNTEAIKQFSNLFAN